ncbi:MAG: hypothetical protein HYU66_23915 [Armatimonadetes bacterium]|nr:hypothetical protein [Armatimonadota bacterium]
MRSRDRRIAPGLFSALLGGCLLAVVSRADPSEPGGEVLDMSGPAGSVTRIERPGFCVDFALPGPGGYSTFSVEAAAARPDVKRLLALFEVLRADPLARELLLARSEVYADVLRQAAVAHWLGADPAAAAALAERSPLRDRLEAARTLGDTLRGEAALREATQQAVWAVTSDLTIERLAAVWSRDAEPEVVFSRQVAIQLLAPYVRLLLAEAGVARPWALPNGGWLPPVSASVGRPAVAVLLPCIPLPRLLAAARECAAKSYDDTAAWYLEHALHRPLGADELDAVRTALADTYERLTARGVDGAATRRQSLAAAFAAGPPPPGERISDALAGGRRALARGDAAGSAQAACLALHLGATGVSLARAEYLLMQASLALRDLPTVREAASDLIACAHSLSPVVRSVFGVADLAGEAEVVLARLARPARSRGG